MEGQVPVPFACYTCDASVTTATPVVGLPAIPLERQVTYVTGKSLSALLLEILSAFVVPYKFLYNSDIHSRLLVPVYK